MSTRFRSTAAGAAALGVLLSAAGCTTASGLGATRDDPAVDADPSPGSSGGGAVHLVADRSVAAFDSCPALRSWYVDRALPDVTAWGWSGPVAPMALGGLRSPAIDSARLGSAGLDSAGQAARASTPSATGTNVQEAGVDEPDVAKAAGGLVVRVHGRRLRLSRVEAGGPRLLAEVVLPRTMWDAQLLLVGDHVLVVSGEAGPPGGPIRGPISSPAGGPAPGRYAPAPSRTRVLDVEVRDPHHPRVVHDRVYRGSLVAARQYGDVVRLVVATGFPDLDFVHPTQHRSQREARRENRRRVRGSTAQDWLPTVHDAGRGGTAPAVACGDVVHPRHPAGLGTLTVLGWRPGRDEAPSSTALTATGDTVYSSADHLYVATPVHAQPTPRPLPGQPPRGLVERPPARPRTALHALALHGTGASYVASGMVMGVVADRWRMDEHDGVLRVATALGRDTWRPWANAMVLLRQDGDRLAKVGKVSGMGHHEQIQAARWFDDLAVLVTFRQVDPLYVVDLGDPASPTVRGQLTLAGYSGYLHPIGGHLLLGVGQDATSHGRTLGPQVGVFDLGDPARPVRLSRLRLGRGAWLPALDEPRALTWDEATSTAYTPAYAWHGGRRTIWLLALGVADDGALTSSRTRLPATVDPGLVRTLPLPGGRHVVAPPHGALRLIG